MFESKIKWVKLFIFIITQIRDVPVLNICFMFICGPTAAATIQIFGYCTPPVFIKSQQEGMVCLRMRTE